MFSPSQNGTVPAPTVRTSRRRPRPSGDSIAPPKAKRQRSALTDSTFVSPDAAPEMEEAKAKIATLSRHENMKDAPASKEIALRGGKKPRSMERGSKGDGSVVLVSCEVESMHMSNEIRRLRMIRILSASFLLYQIVCAQTLQVCALLVDMKGICNND